MKRILLIMWIMALALLLCASCSAAEPVRVLCLKGPTGMGLAKLMEDSEQGRTENRYMFRVVSTPEEVVTALARGEVDVAAMPSNMAAILWNRTRGSIRLLSVNTLGALSILERGDAIHSIANLRGRTLLAAGRGAAPEFGLNYLLRQNGLEPGMDCRVEWLSEHAEVLSHLAAGKGDACLLPYPFAAVAMAKVEGLREALSLAEEWHKLGNGSEFVMGVNAARREFVEEHGGEVSAFLRESRASAEYVNAHPGEAAELVVKRGIFNNTALVERAIPHCGITAMTGPGMRDAVNGYLQALFEAEPRSVGGALPDEGFYYDDPND